MGTPAPASTAPAHDLSTVRSSARGLLTQRTPCVGEDVKGIHAEDHLLQRAAGESPDKQQVQLIEHDAVGPEHVHVAVIVDLGLQPRGGDRQRLVAASGQRG